MLFCTLLILSPDRSGVGAFLGFYNENGWTGALTERGTRLDSELIPILKINDVRHASKCT